MIQPFLLTVTLTICAHTYNLSSDLWTRKTLIIFRYPRINQVKLNKLKEIADFENLRQNAPVNGADNC